MNTELMFAVMFATAGALGGLFPTGLSRFQRRASVAMLLFGGIGIGKFLALHP